MKNSHKASNSARSSSITPSFDAAAVLLDVAGLKARDPLRLLDGECGYAGLFFSPGPPPAREKRVWNDALRAGWFCFRHEGCPSGSAIASLAFSLPREGMAVQAVSDDALLLQLAGPRVRVRMPSKRKIFGPEEVRKGYGVEPWQIPDLFSLIGHSPAGVPGVLGMTPVLARRILAKFSGVHELLARLDLLETYVFRNAGSLQVLLDKQTGRIRTAYARLHLDTGAELPVSCAALERKKYAMLI
jgi:hypothetical protein